MMSANLGEGTMAKKNVSFNPFIFLVFLAVGYFLAKDIMGGFDSYQFAFDMEKGSVWRGRESDGKVSYCVLTDWGNFPDSTVVCTDWSED